VGVSRSLLQNLLGGPKEIAVLAGVLARAVRLAGHPADLLRSAPGASGPIREVAAQACAKLLPQHPHEARLDTHHVPEQTAVGGKVDVGCDHGCVLAQLADVADTHLQHGVDDRFIEPVNRLWAKPIEVPVKGAVVRDGGSEELGEDPQGVAVGDALTQLAQVPVLDARQDEGAQHLSRADPVAPRSWALETPNEVGVDPVDEISVAIEKVGDAL
jgi:hypothetical protein